MLILGPQTNESGANRSGPDRAYNGTSVGAGSIAAHPNAAAPIAALSSAPGDRGAVGKSPRAALHTRSRKKITARFAPSIRRSVIRCGTSVWWPD